MLPQTGAGETQPMRHKFATGLYEGCDLGLKISAINDVCTATKGQTYSICRSLRTLPIASTAKRISCVPRPFFKSSSVAFDSAVSRSGSPKAVAISNGLMLTSRVRRHHPQYVERILRHVTQMMVVLPAIQPRYVVQIGTNLDSDKVAF